MSQQSAIVQTSNAGTDIAPVLGTLQSVGPNNQTSPALPSLQTNVTTTTTVQAQTQPQQTQYISQPTKQIQVQQSQPQPQPPPPQPQPQPPPPQQQSQQQSSAPNSFSDFPQVCNRVYRKIECLKLHLLLILHT